MGEMADQKAITVTVTGRVQGIGYRYAVVHAAQELGLVGWVWNAPDGSVKAFAQGDEPALGQLITFLRQGPRSARVRSVEILSVDPDASLHGFAVRL